MNGKVFLIAFVCIAYTVTCGYCQEDEDRLVAKRPLPVKLCGRNEEYVQDKKPCPPDTCSAHYYPPPCAPPRPDAPKTPGCVCKSKHYRLNGTCVPQSQCPPKECVNDPNAINGCNNRCGRRCGDKKTMICPLNCILGCDCAKGYVYDPNVKLCVLPQDCTPTCGKNEEWNSCGTSCPQASCDFPNPEMCLNKKCEPGCFCKEGYLRTPDNKCVLPEKCGEIMGCDPCLNQTYVSCTFRCPNQVCPTVDWPMACKPGRNCPGGCGCKPGFRWNENDECIWAGDCPEITCEHPNTYWNPCSSPDLMEDCTNQQNQEDLPTPDICNPWCICQQGYFRDSSYNCVLPENCS